MQAACSPAQLDHHLVARVQNRITGQNAHDVHALLATYFGLCNMAESDPAVAEHLAAVEVRLRVFCATGRMR